LGTKITAKKKTSKSTHDEDDGGISSTWVGLRKEKATQERGTVGTLQENDGADNQTLVEKETQGSTGGLGKEN